MAKIKIVDLVLVEIKQVGLVPWVEHKGKHPKIKFQHHERTYTYTVPSTATDHRSALNCRAGIRRLLRQLQESDLPSRK